MIEKILNAKEYFKAIPESILEKRSIWKLSLELRFLQSIISDTTAFETGYIKTNQSISLPMRKMNQLWKISCLVEKRRWKVENR